MRRAMRRFAWTLGAAALLLAGWGDAARAQVEVEAPGEEAWEASVRAVAEAALPVLEKVSGGVTLGGPLKIRFAKDPSETRQLDADWKDGGVLAVKVGKRRGYRGHAVVTAMARGFAAKVVADPWLQETLAYLFAYHALAKLPEVYHHRTFLLEVLGDAKGAKGIALGEWKPAGVTSTSHTADPEIALVFAYLYGADRTLGDDVIRGACGKVAATGPASLDAFLAAVDEVAGKPCAEYFTGWALAGAGAPAGEGEGGAEGGGEGGEGGGEGAAGAKPKFALESFYDPDGDVLLNFEEEQAGTDPKNPDTDGDTLLDGEEVHDLGTDPAHKDKVKVPLDGNAKKWLRMKKWKSTDVKGDHKGGAAGADLLAYSICADDRFIYMQIEADAMAGSDVVYNVAFDKDDDGTQDFIVSFRADRHRWLVETHGQKTLEWAEHKNHRLMALMVKDTTAEIRIPIAAMRGLGPKFTLLVYSQAKAGGKLQYADACLKEKIDLDRWRQ